MSATVVIIAGLSGAGKTTASDELCAKNNRFRMSRSHTTRAPRGDGRDAEYIYIDKGEFSQLVDAGAFVEHTNYGGTCYGTSKAELYSIINDGNIPVLVLDYNGIVSFKSAGIFDRVVAIYIYSDFDTVDKRLYNRIMADGVTDDKVKLYEKRTKVNISDSIDMPERAKNIDAFIRNDDLRECACEIERVVLGGATQPYDTRYDTALAIRRDALAYLNKN